MEFMGIGNRSQQIVWHQSTVNAFGDRGKCLVLTLEPHLYDVIMS